MAAIFVKGSNEQFTNAIIKLREMVGANNASERVKLYESVLFSIVELYGVAKSNQEKAEKYDATEAAIAAMHAPNETHN